MGAREQGSVLLPLVAAMLILLSAGTALSELFADQRLATVSDVQSAQAYWAAEGGTWHAAQLSAAISTAEALSASSYTVTKTDEVYTATAVCSGVTRIVTRDVTTSISQSSSSDVLDATASAATASQDDSDEVTLKLVSISGSDHEIETIALSADISTTDLKSCYLDSKKILEDHESLPTGALTAQNGSASDKTISAGDDPDFTIQFMDELAVGTYTFTLDLVFTDGSSDTVVFTVEWDD